MYQFWADAYLDAARIMTGGERIRDLFVNAERLSSCEATVRLGFDHVEFGVGGRRVQVASVGVACLRQGGVTWVVAANSAADSVVPRINGLPPVGAVTRLWRTATLDRGSSGEVTLRLPSMGVGAWSIH
jgi:hypothetical protein